RRPHAHAARPQRRVRMDRRHSPDPGPLSLRVPGGRRQVAGRSRGSGRARRRVRRAELRRDRGRPLALLLAATLAALQAAQAPDALGATASPTELTAAAAALRAGAPPATLTELRRIRREPLTVPLAVLTDLVASGVPVDSAAAAVLSLAAKARDADLVEFRR